MLSGFALPATFHTSPIRRTHPPPPKPMKLGIHIKPLNFTEWLDTATRDLVPSAQGRVRPEIEAHYAEAVKSRLDKGSSETVAQAAALAELGSPYAAAKRFSHAYLTTTDTRVIADLLESNRGLLWSKSSCIWRWVFTSFILFSFLVSSLADNPRHDNIRAAVFWLVVMGWASLVHNASKLVINRCIGPSRTPASLRELLLIKSISLGIFWLLFLPFPGLNLNLWIYLVAIFAYNGNVISNWLGLRKKLRTAREDDIATSTPTAA